MRKNIILLVSIFVSLFFVSCELGDFNFQDNPNELTPNDVSPDFLLNEIQIQFQQVMRELIRNADDIMRYESMTDTYSDIVEDPILNTEWTVLYGLRNNVSVLEGLVAENENLYFHRGIAKLLSGYATATMVDYVGDIPYSQSNQGLETPNPIADNGADIYNDILTNIDEAILDLNNIVLSPLTDLYYNGDAQKWIAFANSLKLKLLLQTRLVDASVSGEINSLIAGGHLISSLSDDFQFNYGTEIEPDSRHFYFERGYSTNGMAEYIGNYFMYMLKDSKSVRDPRLRYYLYRQSDIDPISTGFIICDGDPIYDYCYVGDAYSGIDHGDEKTGRADRFLRTTYGLYPGGGAFDADNFTNAQSSTNIGGAGILPLLTSSIVKFLMAESALTIGTTGDPVVLLEEAIRESMNKVLNFAIVNPAFAATTTDVDNYVTEVLTAYSNATSDDERLDIIITEFYLAGFGNSIEAYNTYRRTGLPSNLQIPVINESIPFPRSFLYPEVAKQRNSSLIPKETTDKVFWDNNPDGFIK